jgi:DNA-directed RNA polymerase subunit F
MDASAYARMAEYFASYMKAHKKDHTVLEQESSNLYAAAAILYDLARAAANKDDIVEAKRRALQALRIFGVLDHTRASDVREWLHKLPPLNE